MNFPELTPTVVRKAVQRYVRVRAACDSLTWLASGLAAGGVVILGSLLLDRFVECAPAWRVWLLRAAMACVLLGIAGAAAVLLRRRSVFPVAVRLDQALPGNQDRWATALDLARRMKDGGPVGDPALVAQLMTDTERVTSDAAVGRLVSKHAVLSALAGVVVIGVLFGLMHGVSAFDAPLLWHRLWQPYGNWPRPSLTVIHIEDVNGRPVPVGTNVLEALPEESPFTLTITTAHKPGWFRRHTADKSKTVSWEATPRLETQDAGGTIQSQEFIVNGRRWTTSLQGVSTSVVFRVRAGDGLTRFIDQPVIPRIRLLSLEYAIRYPGYSRIPPVKRSPLESERLSVLEGSQLDFFVTYDSPAQSLRAFFEVLSAKPDTAAKGVAARITMNVGEGGQEQAAPAEKVGQRRELKMIRGREDRGRFSLAADESGVLRIQAVGTNGVPGRERVCVIEAVRDSPPRLRIAGLEPDSWIVPGEVVGFEFSAEDDLGVSDLVLEWASTGRPGAAPAGLGGEEYINSDQFGQKQVEGRELIQRMNYPVYAQSPFAIAVVAVDSRGQESRTSDYRIQLLRDDLASRYETGLKLLAQLADLAEFRSANARALMNQLNILSAATQGVGRWTPAQDGLMRGLLESLRAEDVYLESAVLQLEFGDIPYRLEQSVALLFASKRLLPTAEDNRAACLAFRTDPSLAQAITNLQAELSAQVEYAGIMKAAATAERARFGAELRMQNAMKLAGRLESAGRAGYEVNAAYYQAQATNLAGQCEGLTNVPPSLKAAAETLRRGAGSNDPVVMQSALYDVAKALAAQPAPASSELGALAVGMSAAATRGGLAEDRFRAAVGDVVKLQGNADLLRPMDTMGLARAWMQDKTRGDAQWYGRPPDAGDVWLVADQLWSRIRAHRLDVLGGRYELDRSRRQEVEAELRESALALQDLASRSTGLDEGARQALLKSMEPVVRNDLASVVSDPARAVFTELPPNLEKAGRARLEVAGQAVKGDWMQIADRMDLLASRYDSLAASFSNTLDQVARGATNAVEGERLAGYGSEASRLQAQIEAMETTCRNLLCLDSLVTLGRQPPVWDHWHPLHGIQLAVTVVAFNAREQVLFRFMNWEQRNRAPVVEGARQVAVDLRLYAGLLRQAAQGQPLNYDFTPLMKASRTLGHLDALKTEYEWIRPALSVGTPAAGSATNLNEVRTKVAASPLGRIALAERVLEAALAAKDLLADNAKASPADVVGRLGTLETAWSARGNDAFPEALAAFRKAATGAPAVSSVPGLKAGQDVLTKEIDAMRVAAQLPPQPPPFRQQQARKSQVQSLGSWWFEDTVRSHEQRNMARSREMDLALVRDLVTASIPALSRPDAGSRVVLEYVVMVELRTRQLAAERRRNQGISLLQGAGGPQLKLPKHIAEEFLRARNRKLPDQFRDWNEVYYRDVSRAAGQ